MTLSPKENFQCCCEVLVGGGGEGGAAFGGAGVEVGEGCSRADEGRCVGHLVVARSMPSRGEDSEPKTGRVATCMARRAEGHGFVVTLEVGIDFGDALEGGAGVGHLDVVVLEEDFCDGHEVPFVRMFADDTD